MKTNTDLFEKTPVPKAVATMAVPTMISMLVVVIYNMAHYKHLLLWVNIWRKI